MAQYQLKVMLNTSIPSSVGYTELTIDILNYEPPPTGKPKKLGKYPFFDPFANYPRRLIQNLEYYKRLEVFFNEEKFKSVVLQYSNQSKIKDLKTENNKIVKPIDQKISNFEFTIQTILCTGFPVNNYFQSMEYYDPHIRTKSITLKGSSWFPFLPGRFDRTFSHLKLEGGIHTVTGVIWVNDALNHPKYMPVIESFGKYNEEKNPEEIEKKKLDLKERRELEINMFILNLYRDNLNQSTARWRSEAPESIDVKMQNRNITTNDITSYTIQKTVQTLILQQLKHAPPIKNFFDDLSFNKYKYSSIEDEFLKNNIFYVRGDINDVRNLENNPEVIELKEQSSINKPYFYWKQIHENVKKAAQINTDLMKLKEESTTAGVFNTRILSDDLNKNFREAIKGKSRELYTNIYKTYIKTQEFLDLAGGILETEELNIFLGDYNNLKVQYDAEKSKKTEVFWFYKTLFENYKEIQLMSKDATLDETKKKAYATIVERMKCFIDTSPGKKDNDNQEVKDNIDRLLDMYTDEQFSTLGNVAYANDLKLFVRKMRTFDTEARTYEFVSSNTDYTDDKNKAEIDGIISEKFKNFNVFSSSLKELAVSRVVSNPFWKIETDKLVGLKKGKIMRKTNKSSNGLFELLSSCKDVNTRCKNDTAIEFLNVGLDEIKDTNKTGGQTITVYEGYVQTNVIKGKITRENYGKLKCFFLNNSLGAMYQRLRKSTSDNFIVKNKVYFDLENEIKKVDDTLNKMNKPKQRKNNKSIVKNKKGGRKSRKIRLKKKRCSKNIKLKKKNNDNKTRKLQMCYSS